MPSSIVPSVNSQLTFPWVLLCTDYQVVIADGWESAQKSMNCREGTEFGGLKVNVDRTKVIIRVDSTPLLSSDV